MSAVIGPFETHTEFCDALYALKGDPLESEGGRIVIYRGNPRSKVSVRSVRVRSVMAVHAF